MWTDERIALIERLWKQGVSASRTADRLNDGQHEHHFTRNSVIGKLNRLGCSVGMKDRLLPPRPSRAPRQRPAKPNVPAANVAVLTLPAVSMPKLCLVPALESPPPVPVAIPKNRRCTVLMLNDKTCRWPIGDPGTPDFHFCGAAPRVGKPYCEHHCRIAYRTVYAVTEMRAVRQHLGPPNDHP